MPLYEYQCELCGYRFEVIQKFSDIPLETCPECSGRLHKLQSAPAFQFKGSGWYITDYARKDQGGPEGKDDAAKSGEAGKPGEAAKDTGSDSPTSTEPGAGEKSSAPAAATTSPPATTKAAETKDTKAS